MQNLNQSRPLSPALLEQQALADRFLAVRTQTQALAAPLSAEDAQIQSMPDVSPTKWHLAHSTWFFETFILKALDATYKIFDADFHFLFNSYYEAEGPRHPRPQRGLLSRPPLSQVLDYRHHVTDAVNARIEGWADREDWPDIAALIELGCHHEEQHQELLLTDIKHVLSCNPLAPGYASPFPKAMQDIPAATWQKIPEGLTEIGHRPPGFAFDNEGPRHKVWLHEAALSSRLVTTGEFLEFIEDGGYQNPMLWLSEGWDWVKSRNRTAPLYWSRQEDGWQIFTLYGRQPINWSEPLCHINLYEADAFATWAGARLPREEELEYATIASLTAQEDHRALHRAEEPPRLHPSPARQIGNTPFTQLSGAVWHWTASAYSAYPGFRTAAGAIGEYNGKFMCNQYVLRGGSCVTPKDHWRPSYRNFFPAHAQWQFSGFRLAKDI
ncbi:ergothioneine biosynthesis protein EgtB [Iodidimonas gelatinilytica]|uniref:Ergothioneine biosynthesis protein EgtB n=1 Tax=Iodidimonas gelatinilytica TaxID=1236966 RepID=A0A5A7MW32_9PROT|nr:ergothioneine biosynthesis protein EgtB [Iodidimonas gelatinilytica]GER00251.1 ergothioneine biosynthesis protein EgtB [Iodidimonas gelatinilytica]